MRLGPVRSEQRGQPQHSRRVLRLPAFQVEQPKVEEQLPVVKAKPDRLLILGKLRAMLSDDAVREAQMVVCERVAGILVDHDAMAANSLRVVFHSKEIV